MNAFVKALAAGALALAIVAPAAQAGIRGLAANPVRFIVTAVESPVPLNAAGATTVAFNTTRVNAPVVVTYNAGCAVAGEPGSWLSVRIMIDGVEVHPRAGADFALCSAISPIDHIYAGVTRQSVIFVPNPGLHSVQVFASLRFATSGLLKDSSIVVED